jgi:hypothetical protein
LILLGALASTTQQSLEGAEELSLPNYVGLSTSAWHQELDVYFTLKVLTLEENVGLGLREPTRIEKNKVEFIPLKFTNFINQSSIEDRPYLSSSGILADIGRVIVSLFGALGFSQLFGLILLYLLNSFLNGFFVYLLLVFGKLYLSKRLHLNLFRLAVFSPWIVLDSTSLMLSPVIRFCGVFFLLLYIFVKKSDRKTSECFLYTLVGLVISTLNGFEFFFFQLSIVFLLLLLVFPSMRFIKILYFWVLLSAASWLTSLALWAITIFTNLKSISDTFNLISYTLFKHSFLRFDSPPLGAVASGSSSLGLLDGLEKLSFNMSIYLPYPLPESFIRKVGLSNEFLTILNVSTSTLTLLILMLLFSQRLNMDPKVLLGLFFWCISAIVINSYVFNHPHHMPPVGLFLIMILFLHLFGRRPIIEYPNR